MSSEYLSKIGVYYININFLDWVENFKGRIAFMESSYLKTFVEVVRTGSVTKAAGNINISQSAVTRRIQYMEKQYKCSLLDRSAIQLKPTDKGQILFEKALKIIEIEQDLELEIGSVETSNNLSFVCTPTFGAAFLPQIMKRWVKGERRGAALTLHQDMPEGIVKSLRRGAIEAAVIEHCPEFCLDEFQTVTLPNDDLVFVAGSDIKLSSFQPQFEELLGHSFLGCNSGCCTQIILERNLQSKGCTTEDFKQFIETSELDLLLQSLLSGAGISFLPLVLVQPFIDKGQLKTYRFDDLLHYRKRSLVMPASTIEGNLACQFAEEIISYFVETRQIG